MTKNRTTTRQLGQAAEQAARRFLEKNGFKLETQNFSAKTGEIDLIMSKQDLLIFVEVRMRSDSRYGSGADTVTRRKQQKIINTAKLYLQSQRELCWQSYRFDVISMSENIDWIPGAFTLD